MSEPAVLVVKTIDGFLSEKVSGSVEFTEEGAKFHAYNGATEYTWWIIARYRWYRNWQNKRRIHRFQSAVPLIVSLTTGITYAAKGGDWVRFDKTGMLHVTW